MQWRAQCSTKVGSSQQYKRTSADRFHSDRPFWCIHDAGNRYRIIPVESRSTNRSPNCRRRLFKCSQGRRHCVRSMIFLRRTTSLTLHSQWDGIGRGGGDRVAGPVHRQSIRKCTEHVRYQPLQRVGCIYRKPTYLHQKWIPAGSQPSLKRRYIEERHAQGHVRLYHSFGMEPHQQRAFHPRYRDRLQERKDRY